MTLKCFRCNQEGHFQASCPKTGRSSYGGDSSVKKKWYAVQIGYTSGVYDSWDKAEKQVKSQPLGVCSMECAAVAKFKGFTQSEGVDAAIAYMGGEALYKA
jgi:hypothetical protein